MIAFDLRCGRDHVFEAWFASGASYEDQAAGGLISCPLCGDASVRKAVMAPAVGRKGNRSAAPTPGRREGTPNLPVPVPVPVPVPEQDASDAGRARDVSDALRALAARQADALRSSNWVGDAFAQKARAMHAGEEKQATIHGRATLSEAVELAREGVPIAPLPFPVVPPRQVN